MKVIVVSDLHGTLIPIKEEFDLLLMCGDGEPVQNQTRQYHKEWLCTDFARWINNLPYRNEDSRVVMIAGNHSFYLQGISKKQKEEWLSNIENDRLIYLDNELYEHFDSESNRVISIFGCPYCKPLKGWPFCRDNYTDYFEKIPYDLDILMTHDAPDILHGGMSTRGRCGGMDFGNKELAWYSLDRHPKYHFFGHIHTSPISEITEYRGIKYANASILGEEYTIEYDPIIFEL